jgi:hypothetical protein
MPTYRKWAHGLALAELATVWANFDTQIAAITMDHVTQVAVLRCEPDV